MRELRWSCAPFPQIEGSITPRTPLPLEVPPHLPSSTLDLSPLDSLQPGYPYRYSLTTHEDSPPVVRVPWFAMGYQPDRAARGSFTSGQRWDAAEAARHKRSKESV